MNIVKGLFNDFKLSKVNYAVLRGYEKLPDALSNDLDIFVDKDSFKQAEAVINTLVESTNGRVVYIRNHFGLKKFILCFDQNLFLTIDLFTIINWKSFSFVDQSMILESTGCHNDIQVVSNGVEAAVTLFKDLLMHGKVKERGNAKSRLLECISNDEVNFRKSLSPYLAVYDLDWLVGCIKSNEWDAIDMRANTFRKMIITSNIKKSGINILKRFCLWSYLLTKDKVGGRGGCFVAIVGPDGSGKTTLVNEVCNDLEGDLFEHCRHYASNFEILPLLSTIKSFFKGMKLTQKSRNVEGFQGHLSGMSQQPNHPFLSFIYIAWYSLDLFLGRVVLRRSRARRELIFFARYYYDYYYQRANQRVPRWVIDLFHWWVPKPEIVFYIDRPAQDIYEKKPELTVEEISRQQNIIDGLAKKYKWFVRIDGSQGVADSKRQIINIINETMADKVREF